MQLINSTANKTRTVLATTASIFDPLGLLSPAVIAYKIFLQKLWQDKLQWDELLPSHLQQECNQMLQTIPKLSQIKITRKVICSSAIHIQLHGFCDISERAYGACLYIHSTNSNKTSCELCSTPKVRQEILSLLQTAGFTLRKWASNHCTFLDTIPRDLQLNIMMSTKCFTPRHRWQQSRTTWPQKAATGNSFPTSEDYGRLQSNLWSITYAEPWVLRLPPMKNCVLYWSRYRPV